MKRIRFSIRALLILAVVTAIGIVVYQRQIQIRSTVKHFESLGGTVGYREGSFDAFHRHTGHFFATPVRLDLSRSRAGEDDLVGIEYLSRLEELYLNRTRITNDDVGEIAKCKRIKKLALWGNSRISGPSVGHLLNLPELEVLDVHETRIVPSRLGDLGKLPKLKRLIFSAEFHSQEADCFSGDVFRRLQTIESLRPVGNCFLWRFRGDDIERFCNSDISEVRRLILRDGELTVEACKAINRLDVDEFDIQSCDIDDRRLQLLDTSRLGRVDIFNHDRKVPDISLQGLTDWMPDGLDDVSVFEDYVQFNYSGRHFWTYRLSLETPPIDSELMKSWLDKGLFTIQLSHEAHLVDDLTTLVEINPAVHLQLFHHLFVWDYIRQLKRLKSLTVYYRSGSLVRFDQDSPLRSLYLFGLDQFSAESAKEIAKLKRLRWLQVRNKRRVTIDDVRPLAENQSLKFVSFSKATDEAVTFLEELCKKNKQRKREQREQEAGREEPAATNGDV